MSAVLEAREPSARYLEEVRPALVRQFGLLATAPGGVAQLRNLIVSLAVRGGLSGREPTDATVASDVTQDGDAPFELPKGWRWQRLGELQPELQNGAASRGDAGGQPITVLRLADIRNRRVSLAETRMVPIRQEDIEKYLLRDGDILITRVNGSADIVGQFNLVEGEPRAIYCDHFIRLRVSRQVLDPRYLVLFASCDVVRTRIGHLFISTAGQKTINQGHISSLPVAIPPLREQARIVARVDELMRLCDALEAKGRLEAEQHGRLLGTLLGTLTDSRTPEELAANWQRIADHFDLLLDRPEAVDALEQTILQLAVRGLLVQQDANDETASDLLARVRAEKERLIRAGELKGEKPLAEIDDVPFNIPRGWAWARLGELGISFDYGSSQKSCDDTAAVLILRMGNVQASRVVFSNLKFLKDQKGELPSLLLEEGDLLFNRTNSFELVGKTALFEGFDRPVTFASYLIRIRPNKSLCDPRYMNIFMNTQDCRKTEIEPDLTQQTGQANYNGTKLRNIRVPLPPREEQTRIVARVTELRRLCADLRQRLDRSSMTQTSLADALVEQALSA